MTSINMVKLNDEQLKQLAQFSSNLSIVFFATAVGPIFSVDVVDPFMIVLGIGFTAGALILSLLILKGVE